jgi:hypothetical protein
MQHQQSPQQFQYPQQPQQQLALKIPKANDRYFVEGIDISLNFYDVRRHRIDKKKGLMILYLLDDEASR